MGEAGGLRRRLGEGAQRPRQPTVDICDCPQRCSEVPSSYLGPEGNKGPSLAFREKAAGSV